MDLHENIEYINITIDTQIFKINLKHAYKLPVVVCRWICIDLICQNQDYSPSFKNIKMYINSLTLFHI